MEEVDEGVRVWGAQGRSPTPYYKISATYLDGFKVPFINQIFSILYRSCCFVLGFCKMDNYIFFVFAQSSLSIYPS